MEKVFIFILIEHITVLVLLILFYRKKKKYFDEMKNFLFHIEPNPVFKTTDTPNVLVEQRTFIEFPEIGFYQMRLHRLHPHKHSKTTSLLYITKGKAHVSVGKKEYKVGPGMFLYVPANVEHAWIVLKPYKYVEYLEIATPSFAYTLFADTIWKV